MTRQTVSGSLILGLLLFILHSGVHALPQAFGVQTDSTGSKKCKAAFADLSDLIALPNTTLYTKEQKEYWSLTSVDETPWCIFSPTNTQDVVKGLQILQRNSLPFAVRSGGHNPAANGSATSTGVLISAEKLQTLEFGSSQGSPIVRVGTGVRWNQVYNFVASKGFMATGGRYYDVGVAGLTLGGGMTYFRSVRGWAADTVVNFEVWTPQTGLVNANSTSNSDLFWALKGGAGNFGYVTRFDLKVFPLTPIYGGNLVTDASGVNSTVAATAAYVESVYGGTDDPLSAVNPTIQRDLGTRQLSTFTNLLHNSSVAVAPPSIRSFTNIRATESTVKGPRDFIGFFNETDVFGSNERRGFRATSAKSTATSVELAYQVFNRYSSELKKIDEAQVYVTYQPMSSSFVQATNAAGDAMSLKPSDGPFIAVLYAATWNTSSDDAYMHEYLARVTNALETATKAAGVYYPFLFLNDCGAGQDPISLYGGGASLPMLQQISHKYDPTGVFQNLAQGTFKLRQPT